MRRGRWSGTQDETDSSVDPTEELAETSAVTAEDAAADEPAPGEQSEPDEPYVPVEMHSEGDHATRAWMIVEPADVPHRWEERAVPVLVVPLLPEEATTILRRGQTPDVDPAEERLARLVAQGRTVDAIARALGITSRSVHRRLVGLRQRLRVGSTAELAAELARRGFGQKE